MSVLKKHTGSPVLRYGLAVAFVALAMLLKALLAPLIQEESPFLLFFFVVLLSAWIGGRGPGLLATGLAAVSAVYFFITLYYSFAIGSTGQAVQLAVFLLEGAFIASLIPASWSGCSLPVCLSQRHVCRSADIPYTGTY